MLRLESEQDRSGFTYNPQSKLGNNRGQSELSSVKRLSVEAKSPELQKESGLARVPSKASKQDSELERDGRNEGLKGKDAEGAEPAM